VVDTVTYQNANNNAVNVEPEGWSAPWPCNTWHGAVIQKWIDAGNTIAPYVKPLPEVKAEKAVEMERAYGLQASQPVVTAHGTFAGGAVSGLKINAQSDLATHIGAAQAKVWRTDHSVILLNPAQLKDVAAAVGQAEEAAYETLQNKLAAIEACADEACVNAITWA
jgi:hypothetical protein